MHIISVKAVQVAILIENVCSERFYAQRLNMARAEVRRVCDRYHEDVFVENQGQTESEVYQRMMTAL